jgi:hypothetical protein
MLKKNGSSTCCCWRTRTEELGEKVRFREPGFRGLGWFRIMGAISAIATRQEMSNFFVRAGMTSTPDCFPEFNEALRLDADLETTCFFEIVGLVEILHRDRLRTHRSRAQRFFKTFSVRQILANGLRFAMPEIVLGEGCPVPEKGSDLARRGQ